VPLKVHHRRSNQPDSGFDRLPHRNTYWTAAFQNDGSVPDQILNISTNAIELLKTIANIFPGLLFSTSTDKNQQIPRNGKMALGISPTDELSSVISPSQLLWGVIASARDGGILNLC